MSTFEAKLLKSFGGLAFGTSEKQAKALFGEPEETDTVIAPDDTSSTIWHYWAKGFTLFFDKDNGNLFCSVEVDRSVNLIIEGENLFENNEKELKLFFKELGFRDIDEENHEWGEKRISFDDAMIDLYFEKGMLVSVNFGVMSAIDTSLIHTN
jgi:hypothetical protein